MEGAVPIPRGWGGGRFKSAGEQFTSILFCNFVLCIKISAEEGCPLLNLLLLFCDNSAQNLVQVF